MINLGSSAEDILREVSRYYAKAVFWVRKRLDGREVRSLVDARMWKYYGKVPMVQKGFSEELSEPIDPVFYRPKGATPWVCSASVRLRDGKPYISPLCLAYYETVVGGCGFFMPCFYHWNCYEGDTPGVVRHCIVVTSHCSLRWRDRTRRAGLQGTDLAIRLAMSLVEGGNYMHTVNNPNGRPSVIIKNSEGYFFGLFRMRDEDGFRTVVELRTFLTTDMLSGKQRYMLCNINNMDRIHNTDPLRLDDQELYRYWYYNGCTDHDELIGRILILRAICVLSQRIEKRMGRLIKTMHVKVEKFNQLFQEQVGLVKHLGTTGEMKENLRDLIMTEAELTCVNAFNLHKEDENLIASIISISEETMQEIEKLRYFQRRREQLVRKVEHWKNSQELLMQKTGDMINGKLAKGK